MNGSNCCTSVLGVRISVQGWLGLGQVVSFPKDVQYKLTLKELEIYDQFTGCNKDELARAYGMTPRGMGKLIQRILSMVNGSSRALGLNPAHFVFIWIRAPVIERTGMVLTDRPACAGSGLSVCTKFCTPSFRSIF